MASKLILRERALLPARPQQLKPSPFTVTAKRLSGSAWSFVLLSQFLFPEQQRFLFLPAGGGEVAIVRPPSLCMRPCLCDEALLLWGWGL